MDFSGLYSQLSKIDFFGSIDTGFPSKADLPQAVSTGVALFPKGLQDAYGTPVQNALTVLQTMVENGRLPPFAFETVVAPVTQLRSVDQYAKALQRFLAVSSNFYRSFLSPYKRSETGMPVRGVLPPVAMFQQDGRMGPFTVTIEDVERLIGGQVAVASLPATYAKHPLIWAILAHEVGGHAFTHADPGLLEQLAKDMVTLAAASPEIKGISREQLGMVWAYWIDEVTADAFATLNVGPAYGPNMAAFFSAAASQGGLIPPKLRMQSRYNSSDPKKVLDPHPPDILRLALILGVSEALGDLASQSKATYVDMLAKLQTILADGDKVQVSGNVPIDNDHMDYVDVAIPLLDAAEFGRRIGQHIATVSLIALGGRGIQELETWDDFDEERAQTIRQHLLEGKQIEGLGDDAQLLAGSTLALLEKPGSYDAVTAALNVALDDSYQRDPIWGTVSPRQLLWGCDTARWVGLQMRTERIEYWTNLQNQ